MNEVAEDDLHVYPNLAAFFYRQLKPGSRPLHPDPHMLLSPSDGKVLQFGQIEGGDIEQVKGMTYSIDALLGKRTPASSIASGSSGLTPEDAEHAQREQQRDEEVIHRDHEFAQVNGIPYTLPDLMSGAPKTEKKSVTDESTDVSQSAVPFLGAQ